MLQAAEERFVELGAPSRLGTVLLNACAASMGVGEDSPAYGIVAGASLMGYSCRLATPARPVTDNIAGAIEDQLIFGDAGELDYEAMADDSERFGRLLEFTATLADNPDAIATLADATPGAWQAFATTATYQLHRNLVANGLPKRALPSGEQLENVLRLGYAIRLVDEIAGEQPMRKDQLGVDGDGADDLVLVVPRNDGPPPAAPIDVDQWLSDSSLVCTHDFEPYAEHVLQLVTLDRLDIVPLMDALLGERPGDDEIDDGVVGALSNARLGYAMRNRETQLLGRSDYVAADDAIATLLEERWGGQVTVGSAVIAGILRDVCSFGFLGGEENLYAATPGTTPDLRRQAIERWADQHFPGDDERTGRDVTVRLIQYGYALHRLFEIHPDALDP